MAGLWINVNLDAVVSNYQQIVKCLNTGSRCMAVVKADAYGLGAVEVARALQEAGCDSFAVTNAEEALVLRQHGIEGLVLVMGPTSQDEWSKLIEEELHFTLTEDSWIPELEEICKKINKNAYIHLKMETGMGRTGFRFEELDKLALLLKNASHVKIQGIYTHFARAAQRDNTYTKEQYGKFMASVDKLLKYGIMPQWKHVCNSAAFLDYPEWHHDFVRIGTLLIGHYPGQGFSDKLNLSDPWAAKSRIVHLRKVPKGTYVGYQSIYKTKNETQLAVIPVGYADGFGVEPHFTPQGWLDLIKIIIKNLAALFGITLGREKIKIKEKTVRVAGKIGMQLTVLDIGDIDCALGDEVSIPLRRTVANPRIVRFYLKNGRIFSKRFLQEGVLSANTE